MSNITKTAYWVVFVLLVITVEVRGRSFGLNTQGTSSSQLVSDGIDHEYQNQSSSSLLLLKRIENIDSTESSCEQLYGFLPCFNSVFGHVFLMVVYEYLLFHGESYLAAGGEQIFKILGPGVFGASAFHVIGALPESLLLLASGFFNSKEIAQEYVYTGVGLLAGSSILSLTILWGTCVIVSSQEFSNNLRSTAPNDSNSSSFSWKRLSASLTDWGITTDSETSSLARIMVCSVIPFLIMQMAKIFPSSSGERIAILTALSVSVVFLLLYFIYQIFRPWVQKRRLEFVKHGHLVSSILQHVQKHALARVLTVKGAPNITAIRRELLREIKFTSTEDDKDKGTEEVMKQFDLDNDGKINKDEFINGFTKWIEEIKLFEKIDLDGNNFISQSELRKLIGDIKFAPPSPESEDDIYQRTWEETDKLVDEEKSSVGAIDKSKWAWVKAITYLVLGFVVLAVLAEPLIDSVQNLSIAASIPSFLVAFVLVPLATNARQATSAIKAASKKTPRTTSLTFSEIYGGVFMNNVLGFSVLLAIIYAREMTWDFSAEVLVVLIVCTVMGFLASFVSTFSLWTSFLAYLLYPISLLLVYILNDVVKYT
ncbi:hypothetical protein D8674_022544 [Pyrus ussuriensis x Pyrus communis]|uniref:EF-hand domain-containing protein n=1 Tax=Pyrus ussuriensis x Pyrus communis TaxID=2448454 RepID=A0A5N5GK60_9ROSA|nr:hypothetical protein D8674_022544 [Pyrus ussuriensis x Pyrus communis]